MSEQPKDTVEQDVERLVDQDPPPRDLAQKVKDQQRRHPR